MVVVSDAMVVSGEVFGMSDSTLVHAPKAIVAAITSGRKRRSMVAFQWGIGLYICLQNKDPMQSIGHLSSCFEHFARALGAPTQYGGVMGDREKNVFQPHGPLPTPTRNGQEAILDSFGQKKSTLGAFWRWAYSQTLENSQRGVFAEYLVGLALNAVEDRHRIEWDAFDLKTPEGITVQVKSSSYLQSWSQDKPSQLKFGIRETAGWSAEENLYADHASRPAQVYVFCVFTTLDPDIADPLDSRQWDFYVVPSSLLNSELGAQKTISLTQLTTRLNAERSSFDHVAEAVSAASSKNKIDPMDP